MIGGGRSACQRISINENTDNFALLTSVAISWKKIFGRNSITCNCCISLYGAKRFDKRVPDKFLVVSCKFNFRIST